MSHLIENLDALNSLTRYPSIPTYHAIGDKGRLTEQRACVFDPGDVIVTEKIDGTNARIVVLPDGRYLIGSRTEWLTCKGDVVHSPALGIVDAVRDVAGRLAWPEDAIHVLYGEVYGGKINAAKQYTGAERYGFRAFDVWSMSAEAATELCSREPTALSSWRESGGQPFWNRPALAALCCSIECDIVPRIDTVKPPPESVAETAKWLAESFTDGSLARIDSGGKGQPEGVVVRNADRSRIAKIRFENYRRAAK